MPDFPIFTYLNCYKMKRSLFLLLALLAFSCKKNLTQPKDNDPRAAFLGTYDITSDKIIYHIYNNTEDWQSTVGMEYHVNKGSMDSTLEVQGEVLKRVSQDSFLIMYNNGFTTVYRNDDGYYFSKKSVRDSISETWTGYKEE
jgi:hypothetical protein